MSTTKKSGKQPTIESSGSAPTATPTWDDDSTDLVTATQEAAIGSVDDMATTMMGPAPDLSKMERGIAATMPGVHTAESPRSNPAPAVARIAVPVAPPPATAAPTPSPPPVATPNEPYIGTVVADRYRVISKLGEGGMGVVYLAEHVIIEKRVALKILSEDFARKADLVQRFMQEAKAASRIGHENIVDITDFGETPSGSVFFSMEFLDGFDLAHHIRSGGPMHFERVRPIITQICRALGAAHGKGIIHRDMKPENVFLIDREGRTDFVKVLDFGIAKMNAMDEGGARLTRTGMIFGTPEYMSPEQAKGDKPDHRVDIYAVGCILYEMLTGDVPFHAETFMGVLTKHMFENPQPLSQRAPAANVPADVEAVVMKALAKDRDLRFQTMKEMSIALAACGGGNAAEGWGNEPSQVIGQRDNSGLINLRRLEAPPPLANSNSPSPPPQSTRPAGRGKMIAGAMVAVLALGGLAAVVVFQQDTRGPSIRIDPPVAKPKTLPPADVTPAPPVVAKMAKISFRSKPSGADICRGDDVIGTTPATLDFPLDSKMIDLVVRKKGFKDYLIAVAPASDREFPSIDLQPAHTPHGGTNRPLPHLDPSDAPSSPPPTKPSATPNRPGGKLRDLKDPFSTAP